MSRLEEVSILAVTIVTASDLIPVVFVSISVTKTNSTEPI
jgi:hypothetical protein